MTMSWLDLLFAHWAVQAEKVQATLPEGLEVDLYEGQAWLGVVPFWMDNVGLRGLPYMPGVKRFPELNVRTYVVQDGKPGVWFYSLDATSSFAVATARATFNLPYYRAHMDTSRNPVEGGWVDYRSVRTHGGVGPGEFLGRFRPSGEVYGAREGTLEHWLTERYCLYSADPKGRVFRGEIHHAPWPLRPAEAEIQTNTVAEHAGFALEGPPAHLHFVDRIDVVGWTLQRA